jgi:tripartite-type tricarboxylate transporter receptor subunit TctC
MKALRSQGLAVAFSVLGVVVGSPVSAQQKNSSIEVIVPWGQGGGADQLARKTGKMLEGVLNAPVTVTNIPGATGNKGMAKLLQRDADGRTVAVLNADTYALLAHANPGWKPGDVIPLAIMTMQPSALFVAEEGRFKSWGDIEKEARLKPGTVKVAITGLGSTDYIALEQLAVKGIKLVPAPYGNPQERYLAVKRGQADVLYEQPGDVRDLVAERQLRPILVFNGERIPMFKDVPAAKELGYPAGVPQFRALVVKAGTASEQVNALSAALEKVAATPEYKALLQEQWAAEVSYVGGNGAAELMKRELTAMKAIVDQLPLHSRHLLESMEVADYIEPF